MATIKKNYIVTKKNVLNELRANGMTLQELRFFSIYLSRINPNDISTRVVRFTISDFQAIMELGRINIDYMKQVTDSLLCKVVHIPKERGGYTSFQLFKECSVDIDEQNEWFVEIDAHDKALPLMFEFKERYFSYQLWNALRLKSSNQLRMYEILKQYERIGSRIVAVDELKGFLGVEEKEYKRFNNFKSRVLDACQQALQKYTDIKFTYEPYGKRGKGGKIQFIKFTIQKNTDYVDQLTLDKFIKEKSLPVEMDTQENNCNDRLDFLSEACNHEFSKSEMMVLYNVMLEHLPYRIIDNDLECYNYLKHKYDEMNMRNEKKKIIHRFGYMKTIIGIE